MIYIVPLSHKFQWKRDMPRSQQFCDYIEKNIKDLNIKVIAEEGSIWRLSSIPEKTTIAQDIALKFNIEHKFCDPEKEERQKIGDTIEQIKEKLGFKDQIKGDSPQHKEIVKELRKFYPIRERRWVEHLNFLKDKNILFLCGLDHIDNSDSFKLLLKESNLDYKILPERFNIRDD